MPLFVQSPQVAHGVYAQEVPVPATVTPTGSNVSVVVMQAPWGPSQVLTYPASWAQFVATFAPAGMSRIGSGYLSTFRKAWPVLGAVRAADLTAVAASATISGVLLVTGKSTGSAGNSIIATTGPADDANANHFNLTVQVSGTTGTTSETYRNLNISGVGADVLLTATQLANSVLVGAVTKLGAGVPAPGSTAMGGGTDGTINSTTYVGSVGLNDKGFALLEGDDTINGVFTDDPGNAIRSTVNAGLFAHVTLTADRIAYMNGPTGQTQAQAQADVANYRATQVCYVDPWAFVADDTDGTVRLAPGAPWAASIAAQVAPSTSIAWRADFVSAMLNGISSLEFNRSASSARQLNDVAGIATLIRRKTGGFSFEAGINTSLTSGVGDLSRTRMGQYMARSVVTSWYPFTDASNVPLYQQDLVNSLDIFLAQLLQNRNLNPAFLPYINAYSIKATSQTNTAASIGGGDYTVGAQITTGSQMSRIYLAMQYGPQVVVSAQ
jgi:hypothetical protein